jgi:hypothetical protein
VSQIALKVARYIGLPVTPGLLQALHKDTKPIVDAGRNKAQAVAYQDYLVFIKNVDPVPRLELNRFTDELWAGSLAKLTKDQELFTPHVAVDVALRSDYWARDAEWGQRVDSAKRDNRIGKVARVDHEPPTCAYCTLLNSRGAVYLSADTAARTLHVADTCSLEFVAKGSTDYPGKALSEAALVKYKEAAKRANPPTTDNILRELNKAGSSDNTPGRVRAHAQDRVMASAEGKLQEAQARVHALEIMQPTSESARLHKDKLLARYRGLVAQLTPKD